MTSFCGGAQIARKKNIAIVCDDVYVLLSYYGADPPVRFFQLERDNFPTETTGMVSVSNCSFSKLLGPGKILARLLEEKTAFVRLSQL
jgi:aspartate/methionine/tyrosine aminotransferase